jgi:hypothetical protein
LLHNLSYSHWFNPFFKFNQFDSMGFFKLNQTIV